MYHMRCRLDTVHLAKVFEFIIKGLYYYLERYQDDAYFLKIFDEILAHIKG